MNQNHLGHDIYVINATFAHNPPTMVPRVLLLCARCSRLGVGLIETQSDRDYATTKDREFDTVEWWHFDDLRIIGSLDAECPSDCESRGRGRGGPERRNPECGNEVTR
jgi:hypothetical protein